MVKVEQYIHRCVDSILNQTFKDFELILVNDGSTDGSPAILEEYASSDSRFVIVHQQNAGLSAARNKGLEIAQGEYVVFLDSDDFIDQNLCEKTYSEALKTSADLVLFYYASVYNGEKILPNLNVVTDSSKSADKFILAYLQHPSVWKWLWKKSFIDNNHLRFYEGLVFEDVPFINRAVMLANSISLLPEALYFYRKRDNSICSSKTRAYCDNACRTYELAYQELQNYTPDDEVLMILYKKKLDLIWDGYVNHTPTSLLRQFRKNIKASVFPNELDWIKTNKLDLTAPQRLFFLSIYGGFITRMVSRIKIAKYKIADWIVMKMIPHSPFIQSLIEKSTDKNG